MGLRFPGFLWTQTPSLSRGATSRFSPFARFVTSMIVHGHGASSRVASLHRRPRQCQQGRLPALKSYIKTVVATIHDGRPCRDYLATYMYIHTATKFTLVDEELDTVRVTSASACSRACYSSLVECGIRAAGPGRLGGHWPWGCPGRTRAAPAGLSNLCVCVCVSHAER